MTDCASLIRRAAGNLRKEVQELRAASSRHRRRGSTPIGSNRRATTGGSTCVFIQTGAGCSPAT